MKREIIEIDEGLCIGCGNCVPECHQGALQVIDGKARLISDLMCEGIGVCVGHCPTGAMKIERREAEPYDERRVMAKICAGGPNVIRAHLEHLEQHRQTVYLEQALDYLKQHDREDPRMQGDTDSRADTEAVTPVGAAAARGTSAASGGGAGGGESARLPVLGQLPARGGGCPGTAARSFNRRSGGGVPGGSVPAVRSDGRSAAAGAAGSEQPSELQQWPVQLHLLNPAAPYVHNADVLLAADCTAFAMGGFHQRLLKGKTLAIACPKLDQGLENYVDKLARMVDESRINTLTVVMMEVPCCRGLLQIAQAAVSQAERKIPIKQMTISLEGEIQNEDWVL